jgi:dTMP kinase
MLVARLRHQGRDVLESVEPGGTPIGQQIRRILLDPANKELTATAELLLMFAARAQNVEQWILPALAQGKIVVSDRFTDSSIAYQGAGRGLGWEKVLEVDRISETGLARAQSRGGLETRLEEQAIEFHKRAREAYHQLALREPQRFRLIEGNGTPDAIAAKVWEQVGALLT